jgi:hypothetical protein
MFWSFSLEISSWLLPKMERSSASWLPIVYMGSCLQWSKAERSRSLKIIHKREMRLEGGWIVKEKEWFNITSLFVACLLSEANRLNSIPFKELTGVLYIDYASMCYFIEQEVDEFKFTHNRNKDFSCQIYIMYLKTVLCNLCLCYNI